MQIAIALLFPIIMAGEPDMTAQPVDVYASQEAWKEAVPDKMEDREAFAYVEEDPDLPRVLLIGDSISIGYTPTVRKELKGVANVMRAPINTGWTQLGLDNFDKIVGSRKWDVIHFNFGLHDLKVMNDDKENPEYQVPPDKYKANLETLVKKLKPMTDKLIWCTTTQVPGNSWSRIEGDEVQYNNIAATVMRRHDIPMDDLHARLVGNLEKYQLPENVHFNEEGYAFLGHIVAQSIQDELEHGDD